MEWFRHNVTRHSYTMQVLYLYFGVSRQSHWERVQQLALLATKEACYEGFIATIREMHPGMGLRKMYQQFHPEGIGRDAFMALGYELGFRLKVIDNPVRTTLSVKSNRYTNLLEGRSFTDVNQLWVSDLFYFMLNGNHYYVVLIMDVYSRRIVGHSVADNMRAENNVNALNQALTLRGIMDYNKQLIHHSDRGAQYISDDYTDLLSQFGIQISMCCDVLENAHCERVNGTIKNDYLKRWTIHDFNDLKVRTQQAVDNYNNRLHATIGKTPIEFETYVKELEIKDRPCLKVFTIKQNVQNPAQIQLNFDAKKST